MAISYSEKATLTCPTCGESFASEIWMLVDAGERPDLAHALREGTLNLVSCPHCGYHGPADAALLFHDPENRRVYFAAPPGTEEHEWREQAQALLYLLVDNLPEEARRPYLGDVQVEQEVEGVRSAILRREGARRRAPGAGPVQTLSPSPLAHGIAHHVVDPAPPEPVTELPPIFAAIQALLAANSAEEFAALVDEHPLLLEPSADAAFAQLMEAAYDQGDRVIAEALHEARATLAELRASHAGVRAPGQPAAASAPDQRADLAEPQTQLSDAAYQAFLRASSADELIIAVRDHPVLLETWADAELAARTEATLDEGNDRLARSIEERRDILAELRAELLGQESIRAAIQALLHATADEDELAQILDDYPILLTDAAQEGLFSFAAEARTQGDQRLAEWALECRAMLRAIRDGLEES
jgi:CpXC motif protein